MIGVAGMYEDLLVLLEPRVHRVPVDSDVPVERWGGIHRLPVSPHGVLRDAVPDPDRPVRGVALEGTVRRVVRGLEKVHPHILLGEVVDRQVPCLVQELDAAAVRDRLAAEHHPHAAWGVLEVQGVRLEHGSVEVEDTFAPLAEWSALDRQCHVRSYRLLLSQYLTPAAPESTPAPKVRGAYTGRAPFGQAIRLRRMCSVENVKNPGVGVPLHARGRVRRDRNVSGKGRDASGDGYGRGQRRTDVLRGRGRRGAVGLRTRGYRGQQDVGGPTHGHRRSLPDHPL